MNLMRTELAVERLRELLHYDPMTGVFTRRVTLSKRYKAGDLVGVHRPDGYTRISVDNVNYFAHRLAWLYVHGVWVNDQIDHINRNRSDNRIKNLRAATRSENCQNVVMFSSNKSGFKGVSWGYKKWRADISVGGKGKQVSLGVFTNVGDAAKAYAAAATKYHTRNPAATSSVL